MLIRKREAQDHSVYPDSVNSKRSELCGVVRDSF